MSRSLTVLATGALTTVQDAGRPGQAALGVGCSGACDRTSYRLANRLVGNGADAAVLEVTFGGLHLRAEDDMVVVTTGARCAGSWPHNAPVTLAGRSGATPRRTVEWASHLRRCARWVRDRPGARLPLHRRAVRSRARRRLCR